MCMIISIVFFSYISSLFSTFSFNTIYMLTQRESALREIRSKRACSLDIFDDIQSSKSTSSRRFNGDFLLKKINQNIFDWIYL